MIQQFICEKKKEHRFKREPVLFFLDQKLFLIKKKEHRFSFEPVLFFLFTYELLNHLFSSILPRPEKQGRHERENKPFDH